MAGDSDVIRWLHLSDLHLGCRATAEWMQFCDDFLRDVEKRCEALGGPADLVLVTGDIADTGEADQYRLLLEIASDLSLVPRLTRLFGKQPPIFSVPGNHDVTRPKDTEQHLYVNLDHYDEGRFGESLWERRDVERIGSLFLAYKNWWDETVSLSKGGVALTKSFFPGDFSAILQNPFPLGIVGLNSAWTQYRAGDFKAKLALPLEQFRNAFGSQQPSDFFDSCEHAILLTHHPSSWLLERHAQDFIGRIATRFCCHLHGHLHSARSMASSISGGPFQVCYQAASFFGRPECSTGRGEERVRRPLGYSWGEISIEGRVRVIPLRYVKRESQAWEFDFDERFGGRDAEGWCVLRPESPRAKLVIRPNPPSPVPGKHMEAYPIGGQKPFVGPRKAIQLQYLDNFYSSAKHSLDVMGHSLTGIVDPARGLTALLNALSHGATVRLLFLNPNNETDPRFAEIERVVGGGINEAYAAKVKRSLDMARYLKDNLTHFVQSKLGRSLPPAEEQDMRRRLQIAVSQQTFFMHIQRSDDVLLASQYSHSPDVGNVAPTTEVTQATDPDLFAFYLKEFDRMWLDAEPWDEVVSERSWFADRSRVLAHLDTVRRTRSVVEGTVAGEVLPAPVMLLVYPTMVCTARCDDCLSQTVLRDRSHMGLDLFSSIVQQAREMGIKCIELSGGGEPLAHPRIEHLLNTLGSLHPGAQRGLLTNGMGLVSDRRSGGTRKRQELADALLLNLSYLRLSFTQQAEKDNKVAQRFWDGTRYLCERRLKTNRQARIGVKFLLTASNGGGLPDKVHLALDAGVDHVKIRTVRSETRRPTMATIRETEQHLADLKTSEWARRYPNAEVQIDLRPIEAGIGFACWISPLLGVVDSDGEMYCCFNYPNEPESAKIGSLRSMSLQDIWGGSSHMEALKRIRKSRRICNGIYGCDCRLLRYQGICEWHLQLAAPRPRVLFPHHEQML